MAPQMAETTPGRPGPAPSSTTCRFRSSAGDDPNPEYLREQTLNVDLQAFFICRVWVGEGGRSAEEEDIRFCEVRCQHHTSVPDHLAQPAGFRVEELELLAAHNINAPQSILPAAEVLGQYGVGSGATLGLMSCCLLRGYLWTLARGGGGEGHGGADGS